MRMQTADPVARVCFVVSPIGEPGTANYERFRSVLETLIRPAVASTNLKVEVVRADDIHKPGSFVRDVLQYLAGAHTVIVDLTGQNPNVFYELGVRHALSPRTIMIAHATADIPADLQEYRALIYGDIPNDERNSDTLRKYLEEIEKTPDVPDNPVLSWLRIPRIPNDLKRTFSARLADAGPTQAQILLFIQQRVLSLGKDVAQSEIDQRFKKTEAEMYYRLEQIRLLGFITKRRDGAAEQFHYRLSSEYEAELT
jgi:hypothetical protein